MDEKRISALKSVIWRLIGVFYLFIISYLTIGSFPQATAITVIHHTIFLFVFYFQDQAWMKVNWGKVYPIPKYRENIIHNEDLRWTPTKTRSLVKGFIYEIIIAIPIMLCLIYLVTGSIENALNISIIYTTSKILLYQVYEQIYDKAMFSIETDNWDEFIDWDEDTKSLAIKIKQ